MPRSKRISDDAVLDATGAVLLARGPHHFTLEQVSRRAGIAPATLIQRFGTKQRLLRAFARRATQQAPAPQQSGSPRTAIVAGLLARTSALSARAAFLHSLELLIEDVRDPRLRASAAQQAQNTERWIAQQLRRTAAAHPRQAAALIYAVWNGALIQWALRGRGSLKAYLRRRLTDALRLLR